MRCLIIYFSPIKIFLYDDGVHCFTFLSYGQRVSQDDVRHLVILELKIRYARNILHILYCTLVPATAGQLRKLFRPRFKIQSIDLSNK